MRLEVGLVTALSLLSACGPPYTRVSRVGPQAPERPEDCPLKLYASASEVHQPFETLCLVDYQDGMMVDDLYEIADQFVKEKACKCGADALVVKETKAKSGSVSITFLAIRLLRTNPTPTSRPRPPKRP